MEKIDRRKVDRRETDRREVERRIADRFKLPLKGTVVFTVKNKEEKRDITVKNISAYGAYFIVDLRPDISDTVTLHLPLEGSEGAFEATATVVRIEDDSKDRFGIAVTFEMIPTSARSELFQRKASQISNLRRYSVGKLMKIYTTYDIV